MSAAERPDESSPFDKDAFSAAISDLRDKLDGLEYVGFDPRLMIKTIKRKCPDEIIFQNDLALILSLYVIRGTNIDKIIGTCSATAAASLSQLKQKYDIITKIADKKTSITVGRFAACFPREIVHCLITVKQARSMTPPEWMDGVAREDYIRICTPVFASLIPRKLGEATAALISAHKYWSKGFAELIQSNQTPAQEEQFYKATLNSPLLSEKERLKYMCDINILSVDKNGVIEVQDWIYYLANLYVEYFTSDSGYFTWSKDFKLDDEASERTVREFNRISKAINEAETEDDDEDTEMVSVSPSTSTQKRPSKPRSGITKKRRKKH